MHGSLGSGCVVRANIGEDCPSLAPTNEAADFPKFGEFVVEAVKLHVREKAAYP